jgi:phage FluMu protein Com
MSTISCAKCNKLKTELSGKGQKMSKCSRCKEVYYCSKVCQRGDWEKHKQSCVSCSKKKSATSSSRGKRATVSSGSIPVLLLAEQHHNVMCMRSNSLLMQTAIQSIRNQGQGAVRILVVNEGNSINPCVEVMMMQMKQSIQAMPDKTRQVKKMVDYMEKNIIVEELDKKKMDGDYLKNITTLPSNPDYIVNSLSALFANVTNLLRFPNEISYRKMMANHGISDAENYYTAGFSFIIDKLNEAKQNLGGGVGSSSALIAKSIDKCITLLSHLTTGGLKLKFTNQQNYIQILIALFESFNEILLIENKPSYTELAQQLSETIAALKENNIHRFQELYMLQSMTAPPLMRVMNSIRDMNLLQAINRRISRPDPPNLVVVILGGIHFENFIALINQDRNLTLLPESIQSFESMKKTMKGGKRKTKRRRRRKRKKTKKRRRKRTRRRR